MVEVKIRFEALNENGRDEATEDSEWGMIRDIIIASAETTIGFCGRKRKRTWFDEDCELMLENICER